MGYQKESLEKLIQFIFEICNSKENKWFKDHLFEILYINNDDNYIDKEILQKINIIQKYLSVEITSSIVYSEFDDFVNEQLFRDYIEMCRFEKGTMNHKINFGEFCRYAHMQLEEMLNYYFIKVYRNLEDIINIIKINNSKYSPLYPPKDISQIQFSTKLFAFKKICDLKYSMFNEIQFISDLRNQNSHRSTLTIESEEEIMTKFQNKFPNYIKSRYQDYKLINEEDRKLFKEGEFIVWKRDEKFSNVHNLLLEFKNIVIINLKETIV